MPKSKHTDKATPAPDTNAAPSAPKKAEQTNTPESLTAAKTITTDSAGSVNQQKEQQEISAEAQLRDAGFLLLNDYSVVPVIDTKNPEELHAAIKKALGGLARHGVEWKKFLHEAMVPLLKVARAEFAQPRVSKCRLNGAPTFQEYCVSIGLSYETARTWIRRDNDPTQGLEGLTGADKTKLLSQKEKERTAVHALTKAVEEGDKETRLAAAKAAKEIFPAPRATDQEILPPVHELPLPRLALQLIREVEVVVNVSKMPKLASIVAKLKAELRVADARDADTERAA